ncbi:MAG TPA: YtxH domain-containing protein [Smithellaceae bacterium]
MSERNGGLLKGLIIGGLIGAVLGVLYAPKSGKEMREELAGKTDDLLSKAKEEYEKALEKSRIVSETAVKRLEELGSSAKEKVEEAESKVNKFAYQGVKAVPGNKNKLKKAFDVGVATYRKEKNKKLI